MTEPNQLTTPEPAGETVEELRDWMALFYEDSRQVIAALNRRIAELEKDNGDTNDAE